MLEFILGICIGIPLGGYIVIFLMKWKMKKMMKQVSSGDMGKLLEVFNVGEDDSE